MLSAMDDHQVWINGGSTMCLTAREHGIVIGLNSQKIQSTHTKD
jgi:hypothetical protein